MGIQSDIEVTRGNTMNSSTNKPVAIAAGPHPPAGKRRVFLVEDHPVVREGLSQLINEEQDLEVCGEAGDLDAALREIPLAAPDVTVIDLLLGDADGLDLVRSLKRDFPGMPTLVLSMYKESLYAERSLRAGARGYVTKQAPTETVLTALRRVLSGSIYVSEAMATRLVSKLVDGAAAGAAADPGAPPDLSRLSDREFEVFRMMGKGAGPKEIAARLGLSVKTIETYQDHLKRKLAAPTGRELLRLAMQHATEESGGRRDPSTT
jgi:DNA-binding NarL/FixJ family response regulator